MRRRYFITVPLIFAAAVVSLPHESRADGPIELGYTAKVGDTSIYQSSLSTKIEQTVNGQQLNTKLQQSDVTTYAAKKVDQDGTILFEVRNERLKFSGEFGGGVAYEFDSQEKDHETASQIGAAVTPLYERLSGAVLSLELSKQGKVKKLVGYSNLLKDVLDGNPLAQRFAGGGSDEAALSNFQELFVVFPTTPVKAGDTWQEPYQLKIPGLGEFQGKRTYTFVGPDQVGEIPTVRITIDTDLSGDLEINMPEAKVSGKFETQKATGTVQFDPATGRILSMESEQTFSGDLTVEAGGNTIPVDFDQTIKTTRKLIDKIPE